MGYQNIGLVFAHWGHLHHVPFRLLTYMAYRARDTDCPPKFYEGREACAVALGRLTPAEPAPGDLSRRAEEYRKARKADFEAVRVAIRALVKAGAISVGQAPGPGQNTEYVLSLAPATTQAQPAERPRVSLPTTQGEPANDPGWPYPPTEEEGTKRTGTPNSAQEGTSPAAAEDYETAQKFLLTLPNREDYLAAVEHLPGGYVAQVPAAAELARADLAAQATPLRVPRGREVAS